MTAAARTGDALTRGTRTNALGCSLDRPGVVEFRHYLEHRTREHIAAAGVDSAANRPCDPPLPAPHGLAAASAEGWQIIVQA